MSKVLDSSAVLAFLYSEPGSQKIATDISSGVLCTVNLAEVLHVLARNDVPLAEAQRAIEKLRLTPVDFTREHAVIATRILTPGFRDRGISLGDRACMATALQMGLPVLTADTNWRGLQVPGLPLEFIR